MERILNSFINSPSIPHWRIKLLLISKFADMAKCALILAKRHRKLNKGASK